MVHLRVASSLFEEHGRAGSSEQLEALYLLGRTLRSQGQQAEAEGVLRRVVDAHRANGPSLPLAEALSSLGICLRWLGRLPEAEACYREALAIFESVEGVDSSGAANMSQNIAILLSRRGEHVEAAALARRAVGVHGRRSSAATPDLAASVGILGNVLWAAGKIDEGESQLRRAIGLAREMSPAPDIGLATKLNDLAARLSTVGRLADSLVLAKEALVIIDGVSGAASARGLGSRTVVARYLRLSAKLDEADWTCRPAYQLELSPSPEGCQLFAEHAESLLLLGCDREAESALLRAGELLPEASGATQSVRCTIAAAIAFFYQSRGDPEGRAGEWLRIADEATN